MNQRQEAKKSVKQAGPEYPGEGAVISIGLLVFKYLDFLTKQLSWGKVWELNKKNNLDF
jgi:hypothetical protein